MSETFLYLFIGICISLIAWGLIRIERVYQYPFFMGTIFISFLLPQAFALHSNPLGVSSVAIERALLMSCLCAAMCWIGYQLQPNIKLLAKLNIVIDERKLFQAGIGLMLIGYFFNFLFSRTIIQKAANGNLTGPTTIYIFFAQVIYIAFSIFILQALKKPTIINIILTIICGFPIVQSIIIGGRRQPTMTFLIIVGLSFLLIRRCVPPRWIFIVAIILSTFLIPLIGKLRGDFWNLVFQQDWQTLFSSSQKSFDTLQKGEILELRNAALIMDAAEQTNKYGFGTEFWNRIVFQYVPGQILGDEFKKSLQFNWGAYDDTLNLYGYSIPRGSTYTGIADCFGEFSYFGCLIFASIGFLFKNLWISSFYLNSTFSRLLYMGLISPAMVGITHGIGRFIQELIFQFIFISLVTFYSQVKIDNHFIHELN